MLNFKGKGEIDKGTSQVRYGVSTRLIKLEPSTFAYVSIPDVLRIPMTLVRFIADLSARTQPTSTPVRCEPRKRI